MKAKVNAFKKWWSSLLQKNKRSNEIKINHINNQNKKNASRDFNVITFETRVYRRTITKC